jgi:hypothetical protein
VLDLYVRRMKQRSDGEMRRARRPPIPASVAAPRWHRPAGCDKWAEHGDSRGRLAPTEHRDVPGRSPPFRRARSRPNSRVPVVADRVRTPDPNVLGRAVFWVVDNGSGHGGQHAARRRWHTRALLAVRVQLGAHAGRMRSAVMTGHACSGAAYQVPVLHPTSAWATCWPGSNRRPSNEAAARSRSSRTCEYTRRVTDASL